MTGIVSLHRRARNGSVRAEHTAVAGFGFEDSFAILTLVKELTRIFRHCLFFFMPADGTCYG